jgi:hypothetical protein
MTQEADDADGETDDRKNADGHDVPMQTHLPTPVQNPFHRQNLQVKNPCKVVHAPCLRYLAVDLDEIASALTDAKFRQTCDLATEEHLHEHEGRGHGKRHAPHSQEATQCEK